MVDYYDSYDFSICFIFILVGNFYIGLCEATQFKTEPYNSISKEETVNMYIFFVVIFTFVSLKLINYFDVPYKTIISPVIIILTVLYLIRITFTSDKKQYKE